MIVCECAFTARDIQRHVGSVVLGPWWDMERPVTIVEHGLEDGTRVITAPMKFKANVPWLKGNLNVEKHMHQSNK